MKYEQSHPWITFSLAVEQKDYAFWLKVGEIASKCEHLSGVPLRPGFARDLNKIFLAKGVMATTAIEGNTLSEEQVLQQIDGDLKLPPSQEYLQQEVQNILDACNEEINAQITDGIVSPSLCPDLIKKYNRQVLKDLEVEEGVIPGQYRPFSVLVGNVYRGAPAEDCDYLIERLCDWLNGPDFIPPSEELRVPFTVIKAIVAHVYLAWIHPFGDGNGRTARMMEFHILFSSGLPLPAAHLLSDHYNTTRPKYYRELDRASKSGGDLMPFLHYATQGLVDGLRDQIRRVQDHQMDVAWENYVHERFREKKTSPTQKRRRDLVLELSSHEWVQVSDIEDLSPAVARMYANAGDRMLQRDLNALMNMDLIFRSGKKVKARKGIVRAFLPARVREEMA
jgi:Fic family protein